MLMLTLEKKFFKLCLERESSKSYKQTNKNPTHATTDLEGNFLNKKFLQQLCVK